MIVFRCHGALRKRHQTITTKKSILCLLALITIFFCQSVVANKLFLFDIKSQTADQALINFAQQTNQTILFSYEVTKQFETNAIKGYYSFEQALIKLLRNTGLTADIDNEKISITIDSQVAKNSLLLKETNNNIANSNTKVSDKDTQLSGIEKIAIVGSREISRSLQELPVPVDILSKNHLQNTGQFEFGRMLQSVAPSFNFASSSISDGTDVLKPATLRGLGPDQTLILVNGKRRHYASLLHINTSVGRGTAGADLNTIPLSAIKRVEILRDGAAAQYGSDAIAGVINIVLDDSNNKGSFNTSFGQYQQGDGNTFDININKGFSFNGQGFFNATLSLTDHKSTNRAGIDGSCQYRLCEKLPNGDFLSKDPREAQANRKTFKIGDPAYQQYSFAYNAQYPFLDGELYSFTIFSQRESDSAAFFRHSTNQLANPYLQDNHALRPDGYLPIIHSNISDTSVNIGFKTELANEIAFDASFTHGENNIAYQTRNSINASYANLLRYQQGMSAQEIRDTIPSSADAYDIHLSLQTLNIDLQKMFDHFSLSFGVELRKDSYQLSSGDEYSYFDYDSQDNSALYNEDALGGIQGFPGIAPQSSVKESRNIASFYAEFTSELFDHLTIDSAIRYDHYDDFGNTSNIKLAANWLVNDSLRLRSSVSTGFRAPSMQQLYFNNISTQFIVHNNNEFKAEQVGTFRNDSPLARLIGIPELQEEKSSNFSLGAIININDSLNITLDYYAINIDDRIVISNKLSPEYSNELAEILLNEQVDKAQVFLNGVNTQTRGLDLIATYKTRFYDGILDLTLAGNITNTKVVDLYTPNNNVLNALTVEQVFSTQDISIIEEWQPKNKLSLYSLYKVNNWLFSLALNRYGEYTITDGDKQTYGAEILTDVRIEQKITTDFSWHLGVNNLFNVTPDINKIANSHAGTIVDEQGNEIVSSSGVFKYSRRSAPFGFNGSYVYLGVNYHF
ncbi:TonB-dependent receptor plug domain-containing protein [Colwelliaceae bacterium 6441]